MFENILNAIIVLAFIAFINGWEPWNRKVEVEGLDDLQEAVEGLTDAINLHNAPAPSEEEHESSIRDAFLPPISPAAHDILVERDRQICEEGFDSEHDDKYQAGELTRAAACYAMSDTRFDMHRYWPWKPHWWKPKSRRVDLIRAGALIIAEIERLDRAVAKEVNNGNSEG